MQSKAKIGQQVIFSLVVLAIFFQIGFHNEGGLDEKVDEDAPENRRAQQLFYAGMEVLGCLFFQAVNMFMGNMFNAILVFQAERPVFLREQANKMYSPTAYYLAGIISSTILMMFYPLISGSISFNFL